MVRHNGEARIAGLAALISNVMNAVHIGVEPVNPEPRGRSGEGGYAPPGEIADHRD